MLTVDPKQRASIDTLLKHPWLAKAAANEPPIIKPCDKEGGSDLMLSAEYHLKETEAKLAAQGHVYNAVTVARAKGRFLKLRAPRLSRGSGSKGKSPKPSTKDAEATSATNDAAMVDVQINDNEEEKACACVLL